jgi:hypothetical protein
LTRSSAGICGVCQYCSNSLRSAGSRITVTLAGMVNTPPPLSSRRMSMSCEYISTHQLTAAYM